MGLLDFLSPALTTATQAAGAYQGAHAQSAKDQQQAVIQKLILQRQQHEQEIKDALTRAQTGEVNARVGDIGSQQALRGVQSQEGQYKLDHPTLDPNSPDVLGRKQQLSIEENQQKIKDEKQYGYHPPVFGSYEKVDSTDADGNPIVSVLDKHTGSVTPTSTKGKPLPVKSGGAAADRTQAQLETASGQATLADQGMSAYEEKVLAGKASLNPLSMQLARSALSGSTSAEFTLNNINPELASYVRFAKQVATAERMITPRGGSNAMTQAEALLSGAGSGGTPEQIKNARAYRAALIHGLSSHRSQGTPASSPGTHTGLSPEDAARAQQDPGFAAWLRQQGHLP